MEEIWKDISNYEGLYQVSNLGNVRSLSHIRKNGRKINQYDLEGNFVRSWNCIMDAERYLNKKRAATPIWACCNNLTKTAYGYRWEYQNQV